MKLFLLFSISVFSLLASAQLPADLKYDVLEYSHDSATVLIRKGKTTSVYDFKSNKILLGPTKETMINFAGSNNYASFDKTGLDFWIYWYNSKGFFPIKSSGEVCTFGRCNPQADSGTIEMNGRLFDVPSGRFLGDSRSQEYNWSRFEIIPYTANLFIINSYQVPEFNGYEKRELDCSGGYTKSGLFNLESKKWIIESTYKQCHILNGFIVCVNEVWQSNNGTDENALQECTDSHLYDVFEIREKEVVKIQGNIEKFDSEMLAKLFGVDSVFNSPDGLHYTTEKNGLQGFVYFDFHNATMFSDDFYFWRILDEQNEFVVYSPYYRHALALNATGDIQLYQIIKNSSDTIAERERIELISSDKEFLVYSILDYLEDDPIFCNSAGCFMRDFSNEGKRVWVETDNNLRNGGQVGLYIINDSLLKMDYFINSAYSGSPVPMESAYLLGEDSLDEQGNTVYFDPNISGLDSSGIYNIRTGEWLIDPLYYSVSGGAKGYLLENKYRNYENTISGHLDYSLADLDGKIIAENISEETLYSSSALFAFAYSGCAADSVFEAPMGSYQHLFKKENQYRLQSNYFIQPVYYMQCGNQFGLYRQDYRFNNLSTNEIYEFVHYNPVLDFYYYVKGDSLYLKSPLINSAVSKQFGKFIFLQPDYLPDSEKAFQLYRIENGDTLILGEQNQRNDLISISSFEMKADLILVNDHTTFVDQSCIECMDADGNWIDYQLYYESESSSVWKKIGDSWQQISPHYATVAAIPNKQFIVSTGFYEFESYDYNGAVNYPPNVKIDSRYLLLDSTMKAVPYMDYFDFAYIEDLGFGLKVQLNKGDKFFFMTYDLVAVTNAEWDRFELENGKLKAIIDTKYEVDPDTGELIYNEYGAPNELVSATTKYFKLP